jgi:outer membrane receptor protein involved in Fe transport
MNLRHRIPVLRALLLPAVLALVWTSSLLAGTTGKVAGRILDEKKDPIPGGNVLLVGTSLGAAANVDGYYTILNIPPGKYDVQIRMVGYRALTVKGIQVSVDNTTKLDATLESEAITTDAIVVTAQKPVVDVSLTSTVATITDNEIKSLPVQELQDIVNLQAGVVDGHFRGGRADEVQYQVNGVSVNNVYDNKSSVRIDRSLIQEVQVITGTFDAEYGQAMSGVVNTVLKSGGERFDFNGEVYTGGFVYPSGGDRGLEYTFRPTTTQSYQLSVSGPTGLPQTFFLVNGRRFLFEDYLWGTRTFVPTDSNDFEHATPRPTGDGAEVALSYTKEWSGLAKITNRSIPAVEISYQILVNSIEGRGLGGSFTWRLNPDGMKHQETFSLFHGIDFTQTVSPTTFYTVSIRQNYFKYTDWVYDDFYDPRYDDAGQARSFNDLYYGAVVQGVDFGRYEQVTNTGVLKGSVTSQVTPSHQLKAGAEVQISNLQFGTAGTLTYRDVGGVQTLVRYVDNPPDYPGVKTYYPTIGSAFIQDLIEWNDLTIRAGVRFEYFDPHATLPSDLANPADSIPGAPHSEQVWASKKTSFAPRVGLSYPITTRSSIFFSYGHFYQLPAMGDMYANADYSKLARIQAGAVDYGVLGNPDVNPERTVQYEFGYKNAVTDNLGVSINLFYKDIRDLLGVEFIDTYNDAQYSRLTNVDFGNVVGITVSLDQRRIGLLSSTLDYTFQQAMGNSSDPRETATLAAEGQDPRPRQIPLNWDQLHTLNLTVQLSQPDDFSVSTIVRFVSGQPYTPALGSGFGSSIEPNSGRKPSGLIVDLRGEKAFTLGAFHLSLFARVFNLFNATFFNGMVFTTTGSPDYSLVPVTDRNTLADPTRYIAPRRIEVGVTMNSSL